MASIIQKLPIELRRVIYNYARPVQNSELLYDIRNYKYSLNIILQQENPPHLILNDIWVFLNDFFGDYYKIWERMFRVKSPRTAERWIRWRYAVNCHQFQINSLWALFTKEERNQYLMRYKL